MLFRSEGQGGSMATGGFGCRSRARSSTGSGRANLLRRDLVRQVHARLLALTGLALQAIEAALAAGDRGPAHRDLAASRAVGMLDGQAPSTGPVDTAEVAEMDEYVARFEALLCARFPGRAPCIG